MCAIKEQRRWELASQVGADQAAVSRVLQDRVLVAVGHPQVAAVVDQCFDLERQELLDADHTTAQRNAPEPTTVRVRIPKIGPVEGDEAIGAASPRHRGHGLGIPHADEKPQGQEAETAGETRASSKPGAPSTEPAVEAARLRLNGYPNGTFCHSQGSLGD